ncbi:MAG: S10 family peptidase [Acidobacteriaceae bacterium]
MLRSTLLRLSALCLLAAAPIFAAAQTQKPEAKPEASATQPSAVPKERTVVTHASVTIDGQTIPYTATTGTLLIYNKKHEAIASVFYIAYTKDGVKDPATRPVTFAWNGGPGGASALVDIGGFGPRRLEWPQPGSPRGELPPYHIVNNQYSILNATDLVFIDAVGTGYSRIVGKGTPKMFYGFNEDASAFAKIIQAYLNHFNRWNSPKFLLGESYGTTRNALLANDLVQQGVYLNGVIECSSALNFEALAFGPGNDLAYVAYLPSYAATAWYHHKLNPEPATVEDVVKKAEQFAEGPYLEALYQGSALPDAQRQQIAGQLSQLTGISASYWLKANLRIPLSVFMARDLGVSGPQAGRYDSRFTLPELQPLLPAATGDASGSAIMGVVTAAFHQYLTQTLNYHSDRPYNQLSGTVFHDWDWKYHTPVNDLGMSVGDTSGIDVAPALSEAMTNDPGMHVMFNNGYYDMATPFFGTLYAIHHMPLAAAERANIHFYYYAVGHMLYVNLKAMPALQKNIDSFIAAATSQSSAK